MQDIYDLVASEFSSVNELIVSQLRSSVERVEDISQYLVASGGKRIRPLVTLLTAGALGNQQNPAQIQLAAAIEFLHTATLLHDDVVDMSNLRRGKPTANANWGNASSVLVGDFVYSKAFQLMVATQNLAIMQVLSDTTVKIAEGEVRQLTAVGDTTLTEATYFEVIENKTAQLFAGATESAAILAGAEASTRQRCRNYGMHLGLAFQLIDDYLDYAGNADALGKNVGDDLSEGKLTLPIIEALSRTRHTSAADYSLLVSIIENKELDQITEVIRIVRDSGAMEYTLNHARQQVSLADDALAALPDSAYKTAMQRLGEFTLSRSH